jgi:hypothetical protein
VFREGREEPEGAHAQPELRDEDLDDIRGGLLGDLPALHGRDLQPDSGGGAAHR